MQTVTVAIVDTDLGRHTKLERLLKSESGIEVLTNVMANGRDKYVSDQAGRPGAVSLEHVGLKVRRLRPRILFINLEPFGSDGLAMIEALNRECPDTFIVLLTDRSIGEEQILEALASGARGYLNHEEDPSYFLKAVRVVDRGEIWVPRKMLGRIMDKVCNGISQWGRGSLDLAS